MPLPPPPPVTQHESYPRGAPATIGNIRVPVEPWTGFTFWPDLHPAPGHMMATFKQRGVRSIFNLHPHYGVQVRGGELCVSVHMMTRRFTF